VNCQSCGRELSATDVTCPSCGQAVGTTGTSGSGAGGARPANAFKFDRARLSQTDLVAGVATFVLLIALFLPWFGVSLGLGVSGTADGLSVHGYLWIAFILCLVEVIYLVVRAGMPDVLKGRLPLPHDSLITTANTINLVLVVLAFVFKPGTGGLSSIHVGWRFGAFVALIAAIVAALPKVAISFSGRIRRH
jgi:hypothetical protein